MPEPLMFETAYRREAYVMEGGSLKRDFEGDKHIPNRPEGFVPFKGNHGPVADYAETLNKKQTKRGFLHYFFFPQIIDTPVNYGARAA